MTFNPEKRYETNPFVDVNAITTSKKKVIIGQGNDILLNQETGEVSTTNVITYREVDDEQFVKLKLSKSLSKQNSFFLFKFLKTTQSSDFDS